MLGLGVRQTVTSAGVGRSVVSKTASRAETAGLDWGVVEALSDQELGWRPYGTPSERTRRMSHAFRGLLSLVPSPRIPKSAEARLMRPCQEAVFREHFPNAPPTPLAFVSTSVLPPRTPLFLTHAALSPTAGRFALAKSRSVSSVALTETQTRADPPVLAVDVADEPFLGADR